MELLYFRVMLNDLIKFSWFIYTFTEDTNARTKKKRHLPYFIYDDNLTYKIFFKFKKQYKRCDNCLISDDIAYCEEKVVKLQQQLFIIYVFCRDTGMELDFNETEIMVFRKGGCLRN
jgi:hypothetical protein